MAVKDKKKAKKKLVNLARKKLDQEGNHGGGQSDPTQKKSAVQSGAAKKLYQIG